MADARSTTAKPQEGAPAQVGEGVPTEESTLPPKPSGQMTPEEQMAAFEESLKESDWGHQPC